MLVLCPLCYSGPEGTCFEGGVFPAKLIFPPDYPLSPPKMQFTCEMFHPNSAYFVVILSFTLRDQHRLRVFESRVLTGIFGLKGEELIGWAELDSQELYNFHSSPNIMMMIKSRGMRCGGHVA
jgi:hypothetical protein